MVQPDIVEASNSGSDFMPHGKGGGFSSDSVRQRLSVGDIAGKQVSLILPPIMDDAPSDGFWDWQPHCV